MKALVGSWDTAPHKLLAEVTALRSKVAQLKAEIEELRAENAMLREVAPVRVPTAEDKPLVTTSV